MIDFKTFPTTRYQGSKRKILPFLYEVVKDIEFDTVLDACGGTGSVSYLFKKMGKSVTYNDKLHFNYIVGKALIENSKHNLTKTDLEDLLGIKQTIQYPNFINKTFDGYYYLNKENKWLDYSVTNILNMNHYGEEILEYKRALAFYALFQSCMIKRPFNLFHRKNLDLRTNNVKRSFGNKVTWEKSFQHYFTQFVNEANEKVFDNGRPCQSVNKSVLDIDPVGYDLVYIDPPYIRKDGDNESSNYLKCYHFLEGLSRYPEWHKLIDYNSPNLRLKNIEESNDFDKQGILETIEEIISKFRNSKIIFSYKVGGKPSIEFIINQMKKHKKNVYRRSKHYTYALNHQNGNAFKNKEVLIIGL